MQNNQIQTCLNKLLSRSLTFDELMVAFTELKQMTNSTSIQIDIVKNQKPVQKKELAKRIQELKEDPECSSDQEQQSKGYFKQLELKEKDILYKKQTGRKHQIISTSNGKVYQCQCHGSLFSSPQGLGGHRRKLKKIENTLD